MIELIFFKPIVQKLICIPGHIFADAVLPLKQTSRKLNFYYFGMNSTPHLKILAIVLIIFECILYSRN